MAEIVETPPGGLTGPDVQLPESVLPESAPFESPVIRIPAPAMDINERLTTRYYMRTNPAGFDVDDAGDPIDPLDDTVEPAIEPAIEPVVEPVDPLDEAAQIGGTESRDIVEDIEMLGEVLPDIAQGVLSGTAKGFHQINKLDPTGILPTIEAFGKRIANFLGIDTGIDEPKYLSGKLAEGFGQFLPGIIPATKVARAMLGTSTIIRRVAAELLGGAVGDYATSSEVEAEGLVGLVKMIDADWAQKFGDTIQHFITKGGGEDIDDFRARLVGAAPGVLLTPILAPLLEGLIKIASSALKSGAANDLVKVIDEVQADVSAKPTTPTTGQVNMRVNQLAFENDVRAGVIRLDDPLTDLDEVRVLQIEQLDPKIAPLVEQSVAVETRAITANAANLRRTIPSTGGKGRRTVQDVGTFFDEQHLQTYGRKLDPTNPEDIEIATQSAVAEIQYQLRQAVTGKGWYQTDIDEAFIVASKIDGLASLADNETHRVIMSAFMSPTSNGKRVPFNMKVGAFNMKQWLDDGTIPFAESGLTSKGIPKGFGLGLPTNAILANMRLIDGLIKKMGPDDFAEWWLTPHTLGELRALRKEFGLKSGPAKVLGKADRIVMGAKIIGEKTGNFSLAMNGFDVTTKDRWNIRGYNRLFGQNTDTQGLKGIADETGLVDQLRNATEGEQMDAFWSEVSQRVGVDERDTQSIAWYFEQFLYNDLGIVSAKPESFSDAARKIAAAPDSIRRDVPGGSVRQGNDTQATAQPRSPRSGGSK